jgi:hypothetical protein
MTTEAEREARWAALKLDRRINVRVARQPALTCTRAARDLDEVAYIIVADRRQTYETATSRIVYIGTSGRGLRRLAASAAQRAPEALRLPGVRRVHVVPVTYRRPGAPVNLLLERALLATFREIHGGLPVLNKRGGTIRLDVAFSVFSKARMRTVLQQAEEADL